MVPSPPLQRSNRACLRAAGTQFFTGSRYNGQNRCTSARMAVRVLHNISNSAPRRMKPQRGDYESICKVGAVGKDGRPHGAYRDYFQVDLQEAVRKRVASYDPISDKYDKTLHGSLTNLEEEHKVPQTTIHDYTKKAQRMNLAFDDPNLYQKKGRAAVVPLEIEAQLVRMLK